MDTKKWILDQIVKIAITNDKQNEKISRKQYDEKTRSYAERRMEKR